MLSAASQRGKPDWRKGTLGPIYLFFFLFKHASLKTWYRLSSFPPDASKKG